MATTAVKLSGWCKTPYRTVRAAILGIDLSLQEDNDPAGVLGVAWTATVLLTDGKGIPAPDWQPVMAKYLTLKPAELLRVREAIEMRQRAFERAAV